MLSHARLAKVYTGDFTRLEAIAILVQIIAANLWIECHHTPIGLVRVTVQDDERPRAILNHFSPVNAVVWEKVITINPPNPTL